MALYRIIDSVGYVWCEGDDQDDLVCDLLELAQLIELTGARDLRVERAPLADVCQAIGL